MKPIRGPETEGARRKANFWNPPASGKKGLPPFPGWTKHVLYLLALCLICASLLMDSPFDSMNQNGFLIYRQPFQSRRKLIEPNPQHLDERKVPAKENKPAASVPSPAISPAGKDDEEPLPAPVRDMESLPVNSLEQIRKDPKRIFLDKKIVVDDLTFTIRNVSEKGIEIQVSNDEISAKTYYFPKVMAEGFASQFLGNVLSPGSAVYGWLALPKLRARQILNLEFSAVGAGKRTETINLEW